MESKRKRRNKKQHKFEVVLLKNNLSFIISFIIHCLFFLVLCLIHSNLDITNMVPIVIDFSSEVDEILDIDPVHFESIQQENFELATDTQSGESPVDDINSDVHINIDYIDDSLAVNSSILDSLPETDDLNKILKTNNNIPIFKQNNDFSGNNDSETTMSNAGSGGHGTDMDRRLTAAGAKTGDIQVSISWNNYNDIDVWLEYKSNAQMSSWINWMIRSNGVAFLDVDMNYRPQTNKPVENIYCAEGVAPFGVYNVYIQNYHRWEKNIDNTLVDVRIIVDDKIIHKRCNIKLSDGLVKIFSFTRKPTKEIMAKRERRQQLKELYGPHTFDTIGYTPDDIIIQQAPTFQ
jgi:hypothetical protein